MRRCFSILLVLCILFSYMSFPCANATENADYMSKNHVYAEENTTVYISDETVFNSPGNVSTYTYGTYPLVARVVVNVHSSSDGIMEEDSAVGLFMNIASVALSFVPQSQLVATVSQIFTFVGLAVSANTYSQAKTFTSYVSYIKQGETRWYDESYYTPWIFSGMTNTYTHVLAGTKDDTTKQWSTTTKDYLDDPIRTASGAFYDNSDDWFKERAKTCTIAQTPQYDLPW